MSNGRISLNDPSSVIVNSITIEKFDGSSKYNITPLLMSLKLTTSIVNNTISGTMIIVDSLNLIDSDQFSIVGEEVVNISVTQETQSNTAPETTLDLQFIVSSVSAEITNEQSSGSLLVIELRTIDYMINAGAMRSRSYSGSSSDIVRNILDNELKTEVPISFFEDTAGTINYAFVVSKPFEKINLVSSQANVNREYLTSSFSFYQSYKGYNFESIENMIQRSLDNNTIIPIFQYKTTTSSDREGYNSILSYIKPYRFNSVNKLAHGFYSTKVISYNMIEKRPEYRTITLPQELTESSHKAYDNFDPRNSKVVIDKFKSIGDQTYFVAHNPLEPNGYKESLLYGSPFMIILSENSLSFRSYGALYLDVGDLVEVQILDNTSLVNPQKSLDNQLSGKYLIKDLTHEIINTGGRFELYSNFNGFKESTLRNTTYYDKQYQTGTLPFKGLQ